MPFNQGVKWQKINNSCTDSFCFEMHCTQCVIFGKVRMILNISLRVIQNDRGKERGQKILSLIDIQHVFISYKLTDIGSNQRKKLWFKDVFIPSKISFKDRIRLSGSDSNPVNLLVWKVINKKSAGRKSTAYWQCYLQQNII